MNNLFPPTLSKANFISVYLRGTLKITGLKDIQKKNI